MSVSQLVVDLLEEWLIEQELLFVHLGLAYLDLLLIHLALEEILIVPVNLVDLVMKTALLLRIVFEVLVPHVCLLVIQGLLLKLTATFIIHLLGKVVSHPVLFLFDPVHLGLILHPLSEFLFCLISSNLLLFLASPVVHVLNDCVSHPVHEVLGSLLSRLDLIQSILLLLVEDARVLLLCTDVLQTLTLTLCQSLSLVLLVFCQHSLQVFFLLSSFFLLESAFSIHFLLQAFDQGDLLAVLLLLFNLSSLLLV